MRDVREPECYQRRVAFDVRVAKLKYGRGGVDELAHGDPKRHFLRGEDCEVGRAPPAVK